VRNSWSETTLFGAGSQKRDLRGSSVKTPCIIFHLRFVCFVAQSGRGRDILICGMIEAYLTLIASGGSFHGNNNSEATLALKIELKAGSYHKRQISNPSTPLPT